MPLLKCEKCGSEMVIKTGEIVITGLCGIGAIVLGETITAALSASPGFALWLFLASKDPCSSAFQSHICPSPKSTPACLKPSQNS